MRHLSKRVLLLIIFIIILILIILAGKLGAKIILAVYSLIIIIIILMYLPRFVNYFLEDKTPHKNVYAPKFKLRTNGQNQAISEYRKEANLANLTLRKKIVAKNIAKAIPYKLKSKKSSISSNPKDIDYKT